MRYYKTTLILIIITIIIQSCAYFHKNDKIIKKEGYLYIPPKASYATVIDSITPFVSDINTFNRFAQYWGYQKNIRPGRYKLDTSLTMEALIEKLIKGKEDEVKLRIPNSPTLFHLAKTVSKSIVADSASLVKAILNHPRIMKDSLNIETSKIYFIPDTYFLLWLTDAQGWVERMISEHDKFWNEQRRQKLEASHMTELEVYTLASIVQMESAKPEEQPIIAAVYLNRLRQGKKLQADPTVIYGYKLKNGFSKKISRVYEKHLLSPSAYNTYVNKGLPPAPIGLPNPSAIDAVLSPQENDYVYFCADPERPGYHKFTKDYKEHIRNSAKYREWLNKQKIQ